MIFANQPPLNCDHISMTLPVDNGIISPMLIVSIFICNQEVQSYNCCEWSYLNSIQFIDWYIDWMVESLNDHISIPIIDAHQSCSSPINNISTWINICVFETIGLLMLIIHLSCLSKFIYIYIYVFTSVYLPNDLMVI